MDTEAKRGKLEKSFTAIGSAVCIGSGLGGTYGLFTGEERRRYRAVKCCNDVLVWCRAAADRQHAGRAAEDAADELHAQERRPRQQRIRHHRRQLQPAALPPSQW